MTCQLDDLLAAIGVGDAQLGQQGLAVGGDPVDTGEHKAAHCPAAGHGSYQGVVLTQLAGDIVGLVLEVGLVAGKAGGKPLAAHLLPVELQLVNTHGGDVQPGLGHRFARAEGLAEHHRQGRDFLFGKMVGGVADPLPLPGSVVHPASLKVQLSPGCITV